MVITIIPMLKVTTIGTIMMVTSTDYVDNNHNQKFHYDDNGNKVIHDNRGDSRTAYDNHSSGITATMRYTILVIMCNQVVVGHMSITLELHTNTMAEAFHYRMAEVNMAALEVADN